MATFRRTSFPPLAIRAQLRWDVVKPVVTMISPRTTIEVGTGQGAMGARVAALTSQSYVGVELDPISYALAKSRIEPFGGQVHNVALSELAPQPAELLCAFEVLEHLEDHRAALAEWINFIAPGGFLVLSVPAHQHRFGPTDTHAGHIRRYAAGELEELVTSAGMLGVRTWFYAAPLGYALEAVRNVIDGRKLASASASGVPIETLTAASGRTRQFERHSWKSAVATAGTFPFKYLQRVWPDGTGLVLLARKPAA
jgi:SAM-dependent methyltransferase